MQPHHQNAGQPIGFPMQIVLSSDSGLAVVPGANADAIH